MPVSGKNAALAIEVCARTSSICAVALSSTICFHLVSPFPGFFGGLTSAMAGLYLIGFAAPAFEAATCHVGETINPARNIPRAVFGSALMATVFFVLLPVVWLGALGPVPLM